MKVVTEGIKIDREMLNKGTIQPETVRMTIYCPLNCHTCPSGDLLCRD